LNNVPKKGSGGGGGGGFLSPGLPMDMNKSISFVAVSSEYETIKQKCSATGRKYTDTEFPAEINSILGFMKNDPGQRSTYGPSRIGWARADDIYRGKTFTVFDHDIHPNDI